MQLEYVQIDAFTARAFSGNPAAVCLMNQDVPDDLLQRIAAELNLSETAFLWREGAGFRLRWFTPTVEVDLCGHATLASAHMLWEGGHLRPDEAAVFETRSGRLTARQGKRGIEIDFPATKVTPQAVHGVEAALGVKALFVGRAKDNLLVEVEDPETVRQARPDTALVLGLQVHGVILTARGEAGGRADFISRFFCPAIGIAEDPVTGAAHCALGPYWAAKLGRSELTAYQASRRGGWVGVSVRGDRCHLSGEAVTILRGRFTDAILG